MNTQLEKKLEENGEVSTTETEARTWLPPVDILESDEDYRVVADMPGLDVSNISIRLDQEMLVIEGKSNVEGLEPIVYRRVFRVVRGLDPDGVKADYKQGVLSVSLAKPQSHKPRRITVTAG